MGCSSKGKHMKSKGKSKSRKSDNVNKQPGTSNSEPDAGRRQCNNPDLDVNPNVDMSSGWNNFIEEQLEKLVFNKIEMIYLQAFQKLLAIGYPVKVAQMAIVINGHIDGPMNTVSNIVSNSIAFLNGSNFTEGCQNLKNLSDRVEYLQDDLLDLTQQNHPEWEESECLRHILASNLLMGRPSACYPSLEGENQNKSGNLVDGSSSKDRDCDCLGFSCMNKKDPSEKNFDDFSNNKDVGLLNKVNLTPILAARLKKNVVAIAALHCAGMEGLPINSWDLPNSLASNESSEESDLEEFDLEEWRRSQSHDGLEKETFLRMFNQVIELEAKVKERKEWAQKKMIQAAEKLGQYLLELKLLKLEKMENERAKKIEKQVHEDKSTMRLLEMEKALRKANSHIDFVTAAVGMLENQNSQVRADVEACRLSASESERSLRGLVKREKKALKKVMTLENQSRELQEQIEEQKKRKLQLNEELLQLNKAQEEAEVKWREELKEKELALALVQEDKRSKKAAEVNLKRKLVALRQKKEIDCQRIKDDMRRLEEELSNLRLSHQSSKMLFQGTSKTYDTWSDAMEAMLPESFILHDSSEKELVSDRGCIICSKNEASILFLPCTHQVLCVNCNEENTMGATCPCCQVQIEQRIRIYGPRS